MFSPTWIAFAREGAIAGQSISAGLTSLRAANYAAMGRYSHAFFNLSIGLERLLKIIFIIDYALKNNGAFPTDKILRNDFGHDIEKLFSYATLVHARMPEPEGRYAWKRGGIEDEILKFLANFAKTTRYYNLDFLVGGRSVKMHGDPIAEWSEKIGSKLLLRHYSKRQREKDFHNAAVIEAMVGEISLVRHTAEDGSPITSIESGALQTSKNILMQKYGTFYSAKICRFLYMVLYDIVHEAHKNKMDVPYLYEFFFPFMNEDNYLLSRKTFPPGGQGP